MSSLQMSVIAGLAFKAAFLFYMTFNVIAMTAICAAAFIEFFPWRKCR